MNVTISEDVLGRYLRIAIWRRLEDGTTLVWTPSGRTESLPGTDASLAIRDEWLWRIPAEAVGPLTQALKAQQGDVVDEVVRRDFEREQDRVDRLIGHLMDRPESVRGGKRVTP